ncbi:MAG: hypothetical protein ACOH18_00050 [Candidatus Saccharimonadaceae bacterium]
MIKHSQKQNGSTLVVVIIILVVAVIGALGFIFWQNFIKNTPDTSVVSGTSDTASADPYKDWNTYESANNKYSIKYPKDWIALKDTVPGGPYIRNFDPSSRQSNSGYPDGYINLTVQLEENDGNFKAYSGHTTTEWFDVLGKTQLQKGPVTYRPEDVKELKISGLSAKSTKATFDETDEEIYILRGYKLYSINLYPYGISSDPTVKLMLDSFTFTY